MNKLLATVPSGKIELAFVNNLPVLQFNCACEDALPYCNAMCCRMRPAQNVALVGDEVGRFKDSSIGVQGMPGVTLMAHKDGACTHLESNKCSVQEHKPSICRRWHCSPGGVGEGVELRDGGFKLSIFNGNLQRRELKL